MASTSFIAPSRAAHRIAGQHSSRNGKGRGDGEEPDDGEYGGSATQKVVGFDPPLWLQRQQWIISKLREYGAKTILDIGCGEGTLLTALARPALTLDSFPLHRFSKLAAQAPSEPSEEDQSNDKKFQGLKIGGPSNVTSSTASTADVISQMTGERAPPPTEEYEQLPKTHWLFSQSRSTTAEISPTQLTGLDLSEEDLLEAKQHLKHVLRQAESRKDIRWDPLQVKLLKGNLAQHDESLVGYDAAIATEVIEHLDESILHAFAPSVLGRLHPKLVLLTTPNYAFHVHFNRDPHHEGDPGFLDPTGKTARRFRHSDHKFEWTTAEFKKWCSRVAQEYGYEVEVSGVGQAIYPPDVKEEERAHARDVEDDVKVDEADEESIKYATQVALFRLKSHYAAASAAAASSADPSSSTNSSIPSSSTSESESAASSRHNSMRRSGKRRARSRRPEHLPFLSDSNFSPELLASPTFDPPHTSPLDSSMSTLDSATHADSGSSRTSPIKKDSSPSQPHHLIFEHRSLSYLELRAEAEGPESADGPEAEMGTAAHEPAAMASAAEIENDVLDRIDGLTAASVANGQKYVAASFWDVWMDDRVRIACRGHMTEMLDALQLGEPEQGIDSTDRLSQAGLGAIVATSPNRDWTLRVWNKPNQFASDLYLFYTGPEMQDWDLPTGVEEVDDDDGASDAASDAEPSGMASN